MKSRIHEVIVKVRFDKPTTRGVAVHMFRDNVHGEFYPWSFDETHPGTMTIKSVRSKPK